MIFSAYDEAPNMIISKYNGRINVVDPVDPDVPFRLFERLSANNKTSAYREALVGESEWNSVADAFFSAANLQSIQEALKSGVFRVSDGKYVLAPQNVEFLKLLMRKMYLQHFAYNTKESAQEQVQHLNERLLHELVPKLHAEAIGYAKYLQDQSSLVVPLALPEPLDRDFRPLEFKFL
jgi:hypothetical protein